MASATFESPTGQKIQLASLPLPRFLPVVYAGRTDTHTHPFTANYKLATENSPTPPPRPDTLQPAGMFLAPPPWRKTRSPPLGVNLSEWDVEEPSPQMNRNSSDESLHEPPYAPRGDRGNDIIVRVGLGNTGFVDQSITAEANQGSANDTGSTMDNKRSSRWRSIREWARRTGNRLHRRDNKQRHEQQLRSASQPGRPFRSSGQCN